MHHFFCTPRQIHGDRIVITGSDVNHIKNVLRMKKGEAVSVYDGEYHEYLCRFLECEDSGAVFAVQEVREQKSELSSRLVLFQGIPKGDKMDLIVQKAVELGAACIVPVMMKRTVVKLDEKKKKNRTQRWQTIARNAASQSGRARIPQVAPVTDFGEALEMGKDLDVLLAPYELAENMKETKELLSSLRPGMSVGVFIGPEGGFDEEEIRQAVFAGARPITLGRRILRTETAGLCALSVLMFCLEQ